MATTSPFRRDRLILQYHRHGWTNTQIANVIHCQPATVSRRLAALDGPLGVLVAEGDRDRVVMLLHRQKQEWDKIGRYVGWSTTQVRDTIWGTR